MSRTRLVVVLFVMVMMIAAATAQAQQVEINLMWWLSEAVGAEYDLNLKIIEQFERRYPNVKVNIQFADWGVITDQIILNTATGEPIDVVWIREEHYYDLATSGMLLDLTPFMERDSEWDPSWLLPGVLESAQVNGVSYALHRDVYPWTVFYNVDQFRAAGLADPTADWTFDDLLEYAKRLSNPEMGRFGMGNIQTNSQAIIMSFGGQFMNEDQTAFLLNEPPAVQALNYMHDFVWVHRAQPIPGELPDWWEPQFASGSVAMQYWGPWAWPVYHENLEFEWDVAPPANGPAGAITRLDGLMLGISTASKHPQEAWELLKYLAWNEEAQTMQVMLGIASPTVRYPETLQAFFDSDNSPRTVQNYLTGLLAGQAGLPRLPLRVRELIDGLINDIMDDARDTTAIGEVQRQAQAILEEIRAANQ